MDPVGTILGLQVDENGFAVVEDFINEEEIKSLKDAGVQFTRDALQEKRKAIFHTSDSGQERDQYFIDSCDKISFFYENVALDEERNLIVDASLSLNKVGHALHTLHPHFKAVTFSQKVKQVCQQLQLIEPVVVQSMYIYKNPGVGSEVIAHQDSSYLYTEPDTLYGFWYALDDATEENGCLAFIPGSHKADVYCRMKRYPDETSSALITVGSKPKWDDALFKPVPVSKGSCVIIHGRVVHRSFHNKSSQSRNAYTFHVYDKRRSHYAKDNWLQTTFHSLY